MVLYTVTVQDHDRHAEVTFHDPEAAISFAEDLAAVGVDSVAVTKVEVLDN